MSHELPTATHTLVYHDGVYRSLWARTDADAVGQALLLSAYPDRRIDEHTNVPKGPSYTLPSGMTTLTVTITAEREILHDGNSVATLVRGPHVSQSARPTAGQLRRFREAREYKYHVRDEHGVDWPNLVGVFKRVFPIAVGNAPSRVTYFGESFDICPG